MVIIPGLLIQWREPKSLLAAAEARGYNVQAIPGFSCIQGLQALSPVQSYRHLSLLPLSVLLCFFQRHKTNLTLIEEETPSSQFLTAFFPLIV